MLCKTHRNLRSQLARCANKENVFRLVKIAFQHDIRMLRDEPLNFIRLNSLDFLTDKDFIKQILDLSHADSRASFPILIKAR